MSVAAEKPNPLQTVHRRTIAGARELPSFLIIGAGATGAYIVLSSAAITAAGTNLQPWLVSIVCYAVLIVPVYLLHRRYSFRSEAAHRQALPRYLAVQAMSVFLTALFSFVAYGSLVMPTPLAAILIAGLTAGINFLVLKAWAFAVPDTPALQS